MAQPTVAAIRGVVEGGLQQADDDYEDECLPAGEVPEYLADVFGKCRSLALELHEVYPPSDDTLLMIERGEEQLSQFVSHSASNAGASVGSVNVLEVGSGSGMISAALLQWALRNCASSVHFHTTDKNPVAVQCTRECLSYVEKVGTHGADTKATFKCLESNFADAFATELSGQVDLLLFNPPYVVTDDPEEMEGKGISISWAGGEQGCEIIDAFLPQVAPLLRKQLSDDDDSTNSTPSSPPAALLMCGIFENDPHGIIAKAKAHGLIGDLIDDRQRGEERLWAIRFIRAH